MLPGPGAASWKLVLVLESGEAAVLVEEISTRVLARPRLLLRSSLPAFHRSPCRASGLEPKRRWDIPPLGDAVHELGQKEETCLVTDWMVRLRRLITLASPREGAGACGRRRILKRSAAGGSSTRARRIPSHSVSARSCGPPWGQQRYSISNTPSPHSETRSK
jgi:hypothetical protein